LCRRGAGSNMIHDQLQGQDAQDGKSEKRMRVDCWRYGS